MAITDLNTSLYERSLKRRLELQSLRNYGANMISFYALYLRAFSTDSDVLFLNPFFVPDENGQLDMFGDSELLYPEEFIGRILDPYIDVIQVSGSEENIGAARIFLDDFGNGKSL